MLLLLLTGQKGRSIHLLKVEDVIFHEDSLELQFSVVLKHTRPGVHQDNIRFQSYIPKQVIMHISLLYIDRTSSLRGQETQLFISTQAPFKGVVRATILRWVKRAMDKAGIDVKCFKPHSTRAAASSHAEAKDAPLSVIMNTAGWTQNITSRKFYDKPVHGKSCFQPAILGS